MVFRNDIALSLNKLFDIKCEKVSKVKKVFNPMIDKFSFFNFESRLISIELSDWLV